MTYVKLKPGISKLTNSRFTISPGEIVKLEDDIPFDRAVFEIVTIPKIVKEQSAVNLMASGKRERAPVLEEKKEEKFSLDDIKNMLDQNSRTVIKRFKELELSNKDFKRILTFEREKLNRKSIIKYIFEHLKRGNTPRKN